MILPSLEIGKQEFERQTGWQLRPEGACKGGSCVPLPGADVNRDPVEIAAVAQALGMPIVRDEARGLYSVGPESGGKLLRSAECPEIVLPTLDGEDFAISSLRGRKVVLVAWASW